MEFDDIPSGGSFKKWFLGTFIPFFPLLKAMCILSDGVTTIIGRGRSRLDLHGIDAGCVAMIYIGVAAALYFHYFWGLHQDSQIISHWGKLLTALVTLSSLTIVIVRVLLRVF